MKGKYFLTTARKAIETKKKLTEFIVIIIMLLKYYLISNENFLRY